MTRYVLTRILWFIPTLWVITMLVFFIGHSSPNPPNLGCPTAESRSSLQQILDCEQRAMHTLGLDKPVFYLALRTQAEADSFSLITQKGVRDAYTSLLRSYGNWTEIDAFYQTKQALVSEVYQLPRPANAQEQEVQDGWKEAAVFLLNSGDPAEIEGFITRLQADSLPERLQPLLSKVEANWQAVQQTATPWKNYLPSLRWYGLDNQYHNWLGGLFKGDFGLSYRDKSPVIGHIAPRLGRTMLFASLSLLLAYGLGLVVGVWSGRFRDTWRDKGSGFLSYVLVSIPDFWFATLLILLFAAGLITQWFDVSYNIYASSFIEYLKTMTLPVLAYGYGAFAFLSRMMRNNMLETMEQDYIRTARAKGLNERQVVWRHALKNALMPFITLLGAALPALIGGSVVLERIFGISGLGSVVFNTTLNKDFPMILAVVVLSASLTLLGYLVSDLLYVWINPRVRLGKSHD